MYKYTYTYLLLNNRRSLRPVDFSILHRLLPMRLHILSGDLGGFCGLCLLLAPVDATKTSGGGLCVSVCVCVCVCV